MKKIHIALGVADIAQSVEEYTKRLGCKPESVIEEHYALWRTEGVNLSIRRVAKQHAGRLRHLGWEDPEAVEFTTEVDCNTILWETFHQRHQREEILEAWPEAQFISEIDTSSSL